MTCDCIEKVETQLTEMMVKQNPGCEIADKVSLQNVSRVLGKETWKVLNNPALGKYKDKGRVKKWTISMMATYCPYCGKKIKEEAAQ